MKKEIERKFLLSNIHPNPSIKGTEICQGYISDDGIKQVRIRTVDNQGFITTKKKTENSRTRLEYEYTIDFDEARELLNNFCETIVEKTRYLVYYMGHCIELDVYKGNNKGLCTAEVELKSEDGIFELPYYLKVVREVTDDPKYSNSNLAVYPYKKWKNNDK